jgi:D-sedoheptulose 7-phosphate isomerase
LKIVTPYVDMLADIIAEKVAHGGKVMFCGNGGSAADAQHLAAELVGRYKINRLPIAALALTTDTSILTAVANDYGYDAVFTRQVMALGKHDDVLVALSTSGNSPSVVKAVEVANAMRIVTIGLTGADGGKLNKLCDGCICIPSAETNHIQEMHIAIGHFFCGVVEQRVKDCVKAELRIRPDKA